MWTRLIYGDAFLVQNWIHQGTKEISNIPELHYN